MRKCGAAVAAAAGLAAWFNEQVVDERAARLKRLRICDSAVPRVAATDVHTQASLTRPIVVEGLIESWPARTSWSFAALRERIGQADVDIGSLSGGSPFWAVAHNALRSESEPGRADLQLYVFDADFSPASGKAGLLADFGALPTLSGDDPFAAGEAAEHPDRPIWRWLLAGPAGSGTLMHQDPWSYSSWNASVVGSKRWVLFPPETPRGLLHPPPEGALLGALA
jgi:hypothetical protein